MTLRTISKLELQAGDGIVDNNLVSSLEFQKDMIGFESRSVTYPTIHQPVSTAQQERMYHNQRPSNSSCSNQQSRLKA
jgi:hypothetical protein